MTVILPQQSKAITHRKDWKVGALFMSTGTGKTRVGVELVNQNNNLDLVVWVGPLQSINPKEPNIPSIKEEIAKWGGFKAKEVIYIGVETIGQSDRSFLALFNRISTSSNTFLIIDESIKIKNLEAKRTQRLLELSKMVELKLILNGEPLTRDLLDLYAQMQFLDPEILRMSLSEFKNTFCQYTTITKAMPGRYKMYKKEFITGYENIDYLYSLIGQYVFECDLHLNVNQLFETANYSLDEETLETYTYLKQKYLDNEMLQYMNNKIFLEMTQKMQHGYCCTEQKFDKVDKWFEKYPEKQTIIFVKYIRSMEACKKRYPNATVLNYKTGSMSLNLQDRPFTIYFDQTWDWGDVIQSAHRNFRTGQTQDVRYLKLVGDVGLEKLIAKNNSKKVGMSEYFKNISKNELNKIL